MIPNTEPAATISPPRNKINPDACLACMAGLTTRRRNSPSPSLPLLLLQIRMRKAWRGMGSQRKYNCCIVNAPDEGLNKQEKCFGLLYRTLSVLFEYGIYLERSGVVRDLFSPDICPGHMKHERWERNTTLTNFSVYFDVTFQFSHNLFVSSFHH